MAVDRELYEAASAKVMATLHEVDAVVEVLGWDEALLGVETDDPEETAREIQRHVGAATDLDCSVSIGQNKLQAKLAPRVTSWGMAGCSGVEGVWAD